MAKVNHYNFDDEGNQITLDKDSGEQTFPEFEIDYWEDDEFFDEEKTEFLWKEMSYWRYSNDHFIYGEG